MAKTSMTRRCPCRHSTQRDKAPATTPRPGPNESQPRASTPAFNPGRHNTPAFPDSSQTNSGRDTDKKRRSSPSASARTLGDGGRRTLGVDERSTPQCRLRILRPHPPSSASLPLEGRSPSLIPQAGQNVSRSLASSENSSRASPSTHSPAALRQKEKEEAGPRTKQRGCSASH